MILSRRDLRKYIRADFSRYPLLRLPFIIRWLIKDEQTRVKHYIWVVRHAEYAVNTGSITRHLWVLWHKRLSNIYRVYINLNSCGKGLRIIHIGGGIYLNANKVGVNFTITTGVVIGKKGTNEHRPVIGDNVNFTLGAKAYGKIFIGDNSIVAPNTVVIKDVPPNSIVSGVPGRIIKTINQ